jgi:hypothetical protein
MMRIRNLILVLLLVPGPGLADVTVDRVVVSVGNIAITESDIDQEVRLAQFLDGEPQSASPSESQRDEARQRLVEQTLLAEEAEADKTELSGIPDEVTRLLREVRKLYSDEAGYKAALASTGFNEDQLSRRLARNVKILRLINRRLRPNAAVDRRDIETYYRETFLPDFAKQEQGPPPHLEEVETVIRETLTQQKVDELLDQWLKEIQSTRRVKVHSN